MVGIYQAEQDAGIDKAIALSRVSQRCPLKFVPPFVVESERAKARVRQGVLYAEAKVLRTGWLEGDDVIEPVDLWLAAAGLDEHAFVGGVIAGWKLVDERGKVVAKSTVADQLPAKLTLQTQALLDAEGLVVANASLAVACQFRGFDFVLRNVDGSYRVVERNASTAHMTQHLKCFGGTGLYEGQRIGRVLRRLSVEVESVSSPRPLPPLLRKAKSADELQEELMRFFGH